MKKTAKKLFGIVLTAAMVASAIPCTVMAAEENVALNKTVTSASNPLGGYDANGNFKYALSNLVDGTVAQNSGFAAIYYAATGKEVTGRPLSDGKAPLQLVVDLGAVYDISKVVLKARTTSGINLEGAIVAVTNDPKCKDDNWYETAEVCNLHTYPDVDNNTSIAGGESHEIAVNGSFRYVVISKLVDAGKAANLTIAELEVYADPTTAKSYNGGIYATDFAEPGDAVAASILPYSGVLGDNESATLIAASYEGDVLDAAKPITLTKADVNAGTASSFTGTMTAGKNYKYFLWNSISGMLPVSDFARTYGTVEVAEGKTVTSLNHQASGEGLGLVNGGSSGSTSSIAHITNTRYDENNNKIYAAEIIDIMVDLGQSYNVTSVKLRPRTSAGNRVDYMRVYAFNDAAWLDGVTKITPELLDANATLLWENGDDKTGGMTDISDMDNSETEEDERLTLQWDDTYSRVIDLDGKTPYRYIMCVSNYEQLAEYRVMSFGEMQVYAIDK